MNSDTIVAPATPHGIGGIAVVRLSGLRSSEVLYKLLNNNNIDRDIKHKTASFFNIYDEHSNLIDESVCTYFKAPNSYTGEDVVEISCHGNPIIVERIVSTCLFYGARLAEPGEFTQKAFINGKMDLVQAESVASLIHSKSEESSALNLRLLSGELSKKLNYIRKKLIEVASLVEFELDVSEDELQPNLAEETSTILNELKQKTEHLLSSYRQTCLLNNGALVVIAGEPNVGKSTLLNALTESDRAITSNLPGTTRDAINVQLVLNGVPINLIDTAGLRDSDEEIEKEGVRRTIGYMETADLILLVQDIFEKTTKSIQLPENIPIIKIINKVDLVSSENSYTLKTIVADKLQISAKTGFGLDKLKDQIKKSLSISGSLADTVSITTNRQHIALQNCNNALNATIGLLKSAPISYELISIEVREALESIGQILGKTTPEDILKNIFSQFCVGK